MHLPAARWPAYVVCVSPGSGGCSGCRGSAPVVPPLSGSAWCIRSFRSNACVVERQIHWSRLFQDPVWACVMTEFKVRIQLYFTTKFTNPLQYCASLYWRAKWNWRRYVYYFPIRMTSTIVRNVPLQLFPRTTLAIVHDSIPQVI